MISTVTGTCGQSVEHTQNNLYVGGLPKFIDNDNSETAYRKIFARYGKISSFKILDKANFPCNVAFVAYKYP